MKRLSKPLDCTCFATSIWDETLYKVGVADIAQSLWRIVLLCQSFILPANNVVVVVVLCFWGGGCRNHPIDPPVHLFCINIDETFTQLKYTT